MLTVAMTQTLGGRLRELREGRDLSLREFAKQLGGVTAAHLSDIEFGRRYPSDDLLKRIARFFRVSEEELSRLDTRPPVEELKRMAHSDPSLGLALRKLANREITGDEVLNLRKGKTDKSTKE
jgi:transcriptional regulator with XRE-family HTH domain